MRLRWLLFLCSLFSVGCASCAPSPDALSLLPKDAQAVGFVDLAVVRRTKLWEAWCDKLQTSMMLDTVDALREDAGFDPFYDIESVTFAVWFEPLPPQFVAVVRMSKELDVESLLAAKGATSETIGNKPALRWLEQWLVRIGPKDFLVGTQKGVERALLVVEKKAEDATQNEELMALRASVRSGSQLWMVSKVPVVARLGLGFASVGGKLPGFDGLGDLATATSATLSFDLREGLWGELRVRVKDAEAAKHLAEQPIVQSASALASFLFLRNMDDWLGSYADQEEWVVRLAIPQSDSNNLLMQALMYSLYTKPPTFYPTEPMPPEPLAPETQEMPAP